MGNEHGGEPHALKKYENVEQRVEFIRAVERDEKSPGTLCEEFGISRKTGYQWLNRYQEFESVERTQRWVDNAGMQTPGQVYFPADRLYSPHLDDNLLPKWSLGHVLVRKTGKIEWNGYRIDVGKVLHEPYLA